ncbi:MAG TPA: glycine oxidase ThiO [Actinomycetota bacterium]|nr:glycine oxidase ThiO [Actinomycetota bacterium]
MAATPDVVVVGGGAVGLGVAWRCAVAGARVQVFDSSGGRGATWAAAGMLAPVTEVHYGEEPLLQLNLQSAARYPAFVQELEAASGRSTGYRQCGTLMVALDADENRAFDELFRFQAGLGLEVQRLTGRETRAEEPGLAPGVRGGILVTGDHQVDNRALLDALGEACRRAGVTISTDAVDYVDVEDDRVVSVTARAHGRVPCGSVVVAAGSWSGDIAGIPPQSRPRVRPVKGQLLHLRGEAGAPVASHNVRGFDAYLVPRADGRLVVGATVEERGWDTTVTAGGVHELLRAAYALLPGTAELALVETIAGLRPGSPDNAPLIGRTPTDGLLLATGHYRNGVLLTPVTADAIAALVMGAEAPAWVAPFRPTRFAEAA